MRTSLGLTQAELAQRTGLSRQALSAIEAGRHVPGTAVALRLARALSCRVEDLFQLVEAPEERPVDSVSTPSPLPRRAVLALVRNRLVAHPLGGDLALTEGFPPADALLTRGGRSPLARLLVPSEWVERTALIMGCDPSLSILAGYLAHRGHPARAVWLPASSRRALKALSLGQAHVAGTHLRDPRGGYNVHYARRALRGEGGLMVAFASWEQGLVVAPGNPRGIHGVADLARPDVSIVNREPGAGCRQLLDSLLKREGIPPSAVRGYDRVVRGHLAVARAVAEGRADAGVALRAVADVFGLHFVPLDAVRFDLVIPDSLLEHPAVSALLDALQERPLREEVGSLPGYDTSQMGRVMARFGPS